jgi:hypothetical protein
MKHHVTLTITSLLSILLFSLHWADEVARGIEPGTVSAVGGLLILAVWLCGTLVLGERRAGLVIILLGAILASGVPSSTCKGQDLSAAGSALPPVPAEGSSGSGRTSRLARTGCCPSSSRRGHSGSCGEVDSADAAALTRVQAR